MSEVLSQQSSVCGGSTQSLSPTQKKPSSWLTRMETLQGYWLVFFALWVPISITGAWIGVATGGVMWLIICILTVIEGAYEVPVNKNISQLESLKIQFMSITGFSGIPFLKPLCIFAAAVYASGFYVGFSGNFATDGFFAAVPVGLRVGYNSLGTLQTFLVYLWVYQALRRAPQLKGWVTSAVLLVGSLSCLYAPIEPRIKDFISKILPAEPGVHAQGLVGACEPFFRWVLGKGANFLQGTGFLEQPMAFAGQMQILMMLALALLLCHGYKKLPAFFSKRPTAIAIACCMVTGMVFSAERSAWLGAIFGTLVVCAVLSRKLVVASVISFVVIGFLSYSTIPIVHDRVDNLLNPTHDPSVMARVEIWKRSLELFRDKPIFGSGIRRFPHVYMDSAMPNKGYLDHAHSNYLHILSTTGLVGLAAYLCMLTMILKGTAARVNTPPDGLSPSEAEQFNYERAIALGLLAATVALCASGLFEYNFGTGHVRLTYFFVLAFLSAKNQVDNQLECR